MTERTYTAIAWKAADGKQPGFLSTVSHVPAPQFIEREKKKQAEREVEKSERAAKEKVSAVVMTSVAEQGFVHDCSSRGSPALYSRE